MMPSQRKAGFQVCLTNQPISEKPIAIAGNPMTRLRANFRRSARPGFQLTSAKGLSMDSDLIELEAIQVLLACFGALLGLFRFVENKVFQDEHIHIGGEETAVGVLWRTDDGLASNVETGVDD